MSRKTKNPRQCQPCTACCDGWVRINVSGFEASPGHPCPFSTGTGCSDYENRPEMPCRQFQCGWVQQGSPLPEWMRPDKARVMVLPDSRRWNGLPVDVAVPVGKRIPPRALNWLKQFAEKNGRPLIYLEHVVENGVYSDQPEVVGYGPPAFQQDVEQMIERGEKLW